MSLICGFENEILHYFVTDLASYYILKLTKIDWKVKILITYPQSGHWQTLLVAIQILNKRFEVCIALSYFH